jgi:hypothetical protein
MAFTDTPAPRGEADKYLVIERAERPACWIPFHSTDDDIHFTEQIVVHRDNVYVGWGSRFFAINVQSKSSIVLQLGGYFGSMWVQDDCVLVASCHRVYRVDHDLTLRWMDDPASGPFQVSRRHVALLHPGAD